MKKVFSILLLSLLSLQIYALDTPKKPNIIFILADDLGYMDLACYGNPYNETPHLNSLAQNGIRFTQAYAASTVCSPSRAAIMTGLHPARLKLTNFLVGNRTEEDSPLLPANWKTYLPSMEITLAQRLKALGYQTGMIGKWHLGSGDSLAPWNRGFDYARMIGKNGLDYYNYGIFQDSFQQVFEDKGERYLTDKLSDYAVDFIGKQTDANPFFLYMCYSAPHVFIVPQATKLNKYFMKYEKFKGQYNPYYATMVESMDEGVGRIMELLKKQGLLKNTLVIFASDNGGVGLPELGPTPTQNDSLRKWKGHVYEGGIRIPTLMFWEGKILPKQVNDTYFMNTDYTATILDLLGQKAPDLTDGISIWPMINKPSIKDQNRPLFWHYPHFSNQMGRPAGAVRLGDWKLVDNFELAQLELYNLKEDVGERHDVAKQFPAKRDELHRLLIDWRKKVQANMPLKK
ncbi:sulfatase [Aquirufa sp. OSTEICH-129A]